MQGGGGRKAAETEAEGGGEAPVAAGGREGSRAAGGKAARGREALIAAGRRQGGFDIIIAGSGSRIRDLGNRLDLGSG